MNLIAEFCGHKNLLITQHKNSQSCTLFSKARVCKSSLKIPNAAYPFLPLSCQAWLQKRSQPKNSGGAKKFGVG